MAQVPVAADVQQSPVEIGGIAGVEVTIHGNESENVILYFTGCLRHRLCGSDGSPGG
jgi:hypothetical protein